MPLYLDYAATTPVRAESAQAVTRVLQESFGNPSSLYAPGRQAAADLKAHRTMVAGALGCAPEELFFTSCGTESNNWAIRAALELGRRRGKHIITTAIEHAAVLEPLRLLELQGYEVTRLTPDETGRVSPADLEAALREDTVLVSMMLVNNELGSVQPVAECVKLTKAFSKDILFHTDAVQGFLKVPFTPKSLGVDLLSVSGHKIHAPKGVGALFMKKDLIKKMKPLLAGGGQESGLRSGTESTALIAGFGEAARLGKAEAPAAQAAMKAVKDYAQATLPAKVEGMQILCATEAPHILAFSLPSYKSQVLVRYLSDLGVYVSAGSACHKGAASHVYAALKLPKSVLDGVLRISFDAATTPADIDTLADALNQAKSALFTTLS